MSTPDDLLHAETVRSIRDSSHEIIGWQEGAV
jgi:hypothetical protein